MHNNEERINIVDLTEGDFTSEEAYRLALESVYRWTWRTDQMDPMDVIRSVRKVLTAALKDS